LAEREGYGDAVVTVDDVVVNRRTCRTVIGGSEIPLR